MKGQYTIDSRDLIDHLEECKDELVDAYNDEHDTELEYDDIEWDDWDSKDWYKELEYIEALIEFVEDCDFKSSELQHGETIIHETYFTEYCEDFVKDVGYLPNDLPWWIESNIDWDGVADEMKQDYSEVNWGNEIYFIR